LQVASLRAWFNISRLVPSLRITKHVIVHGRVQGVNYRESMRVAAERLDVTGWVRNRSDSTVEAMVHGDAEAVSKLLDWCRRGPPAARVTAVQVDEASGVFTGFERYPDG
jgi:acylphosphatase